MVIERASGGASLIDVLGRVLDKGIVIDAWVRVSLVGIDLITPSRGGRPSCIRR
jgi:gas vesicle structural protein